MSSRDSEKVFGQFKMMPGFGNDFETEALHKALPRGRNSPQKCAYGLYAEQLSGSPFTAPPSTNERSWLYRIRPSVRHTGRFSRIEMPLWRTAPDAEPHDLPLGQYRWNPLPLPKDRTDFIDGMHTMTSTGDARQHSGMATHIYAMFPPYSVDSVFCPFGNNDTLHRAILLTTVNVKCFCVDLDF